MSWTLSGLFLVGAKSLNRPRKRKRTNREHSRTIPEQIGKIPEKSAKDKKGQKIVRISGFSSLSSAIAVFLAHSAEKGQKRRTKKEGQKSPDRETPPFETPRFSGPWAYCGNFCSFALQSPCSENGQLWSTAHSNNAKPCMQILATERKVWTFCLKSRVQNCEKRPVKKTCRQQNKA